ncbi:hypothetical protein VTN49DRAFT_5664 [Thermomyces lanuginosus]|uniref:uncharacterized protein n=1 Tax=Thermomyces lanuginosus TaxID=5541 RepID=UPI00374415B5
MSPGHPAPEVEEEGTGQTVVPISRIKRIIQQDEDIVQCSNKATFLIAMATELFIQYLAEQGYNVVKSERKPRKTLQYKDLATAVSRIDNLEFLADVIPKTTTYRQFKEKRAREGAQEAGLEKGQTTLNGTTTRAENGSARASSAGGRRASLSVQLNDGEVPPATRSPTVSMMVDQSDEHANGDVEMSG